MSFSGGLTAPRMLPVRLPVPSREGLCPRLPMLGAIPSSNGRQTSSSIGPGQGTTTYPYSSRQAPWSGSRLAAPIACWFEMRWLDRSPRRWQHRCSTVTCSWPAELSARQGQLGVSAQTRVRPPLLCSGSVVAFVARQTRSRTGWRRMAWTAVAELDRYLGSSIEWAIRTDSTWTRSRHLYL